MIHGRMQSLLTSKWQACALDPGKSVQQLMIRPSTQRKPAKAWLCAACVQVNVTVNIPTPAPVPTPVRCCSLTNALFSQQFNVMHNCHGQADVSSQLLVSEHMAAVLPEHPITTSDGSNLVSRRRDAGRRAHSCGCQQNDSS